MLRRIFQTSLIIFLTIILFLSGCVSSGISQTSSPAKTITVTLPASATAGSKFVQAPIIIDKNADGHIIKANFVKFVGSVLNPKTTVTVNNIPVNVSDDGSYYVYLFLNPGNNNIEIATTENQITSSERISIVFLPPLAIIMYYPDNNTNVDARKSPVIARGKVSDPAAQVKVNDQLASVNPDGTFSVQIQLKEGLNVLRSIATRMNETDSDGDTYEVDNLGRVTSHPGFGLQYTSNFIFFNPVYSPVLELKAGQSGLLDFIYSENKDVPFEGGDYNAEISRMSDPQTGHNVLPDLPGLEATIVNPGFRVYPRIDYHSQISIKTKESLVPGDYYFKVDTKTGFGAAFSFFVRIEK